MEIVLKLMDIYWDMISSGLKTVEGRAMSKSKDYSALRKGDRIIFINSKGNSLVRYVQYVKHYDSLKEFFDEEGLKNILPNVNSYDEASNIYNSLPGYRDKIKKYGIYAIKLSREKV